MKIILLLAFVAPALATFDQGWKQEQSNLRRKWFYQHHLGARGGNVRRSSPNNKSIDKFADMMRQQKLQNVRRRQPNPVIISDITSDKDLINQLLGSFGFN